MLCVFYRRLEFGATVREPSHYLNASRAPHATLPGFLWGPYRGSTYTSRGSGTCAVCYPGDSRGQWRQGVPWVVRLGVLGGVRGTWETLEAAVLPGSGLGWWLVWGGLPLFVSGALPLLLYPGSGNFLSILLGTPWAP